MISINFAGKNYRLIERIHSGLIIAIFLSSLMTIGMIWKAVSLRMSIVAIEKTLQERHMTDDQLQPVLKEREQFVKDLSAMSGLLEARKFSWTRLLTSLESVVPVGTALKSVDYNPENHTLVLDGIALSPEALRNLVQSMEKNPAFKDPFLKHQSLDKGNISFNVIAIYR